ncbi:MAG: PepSY domain-containing protein, partial [Actinomycetospora chiangmaiensis]|nr:PepSY domain-containing protein [Actinomycetospora chiangmaiensis]
AASPCRGEPPASVEVVKRNMAAMGYSRITVYEGEDGHWEGEGIKRGRLMRFRIDPASGTVTSERVSD